MSDPLKLPGIPRGDADTVNLLVLEYAAGDGVTLKRVYKRDGSHTWAVRNSIGDVLNKSGDWEWEPSPSGRDDAFLARCRFASSEEALAALTAHRQKEL